MIGQGEIGWLVDAGGSRIDVEAAGGGIDRI
jgi:hypothetical protein